MPKGLEGGSSADNIDMDEAEDSSSGQLQVKAACAKEMADRELKDCFPVDRPELKDCIPVMVSIKAPLSRMAVAERPPVDLVLVLNVQKGHPAPVNWLMLLMEAVEVALGKLSDNDRLVVLADSRTRSAEATTGKSEEEMMQATYAKFSEEVKLMQVSDKNCRRVQVSAVNKAIRSDTLVVKALELANSMLHNREYEDKEDRAAYVIVISNSGEQDIGSLLAWRFLSVHAFGFRDAQNARTMCAIASSRECTYALLDDERGRITEAFAACIDRITSAGAGMPIEVKLKCESEVVLEAIDAPRITYFISYEKNAGTIWTSSHQAWVPKKFMVYLKPQQGKEKLNNMDLLKSFTVRVKYGHITVHAPDKLDGKGVMTKSDKLEGEVRLPSDMLGGRVVPESDKLHGKVLAEPGGNLDSKMMMVSDEPDRKVVMESKKPDGKTVAESDGKVVPESNNLNLNMKVVEVSKKLLYRKELAESTEVDGKVELESGKMEGKVVEYEKPDKLDRMVIAESDYIDGNVVPESDKMDRKVVMGWSSKLNGKVLDKSDKLGLKLKVKTIEHDGEVVLVRKGVEGYKEMAGEMVRIKAVKIVADITREDMDPKQLHLVKLSENLHEQWTKLQDSDCGKEAGEAGLISMLALEMQEMQIRLHYNYFWLEYMLSWLSHQWWQLPVPPLVTEKRATQVDPPLQLAIFPKERATPWANEYTVPRPLKVAVRIAAPGLKRCPVDLIVVLDASCGAKENTQKRQRLLVKAMELVMTKLDHKDRLAIVHVQSSITEPAAVTSLMTMSEQGQNEISAMLKSLVVSKPPPAMAIEKANQNSRWREQLNRAMTLVRKLLNTASVDTSIGILTSPERQSTAVVAQSVVGTSNLWKALEGAKEILVDRPLAEKEQRAGFIIVISDNNDNSIIHTTSRRPETDFDYIVHAISFHDSGPRNTRAMNHIAHCSNGIYAVLDDGQDQITDAFTSCINKITSIVAVSTMVSIRCSRDSIVALDNIQSAGHVLHSIDHDKKSASISAGAFYAGTVRNFIAIVDNVGWYEYGMFYKFCTVDITWRHPLRRKEDKLRGEVYVRDTSEVFKEVESRLIVAKTVTVITDHILDKILVADGETVEKDKQVIDQPSMDKLNRLFQECSTEARDAGEALLAKEMDKLKNNLEKERVRMHENQSVGKGIDLTYIKELLAEQLSYMLSSLSRNF